MTWWHRLIIYWASRTNCSFIICAFTFQKDIAINIFIIHYCLWFKLCLMTLWNQKYNSEDWQAVHPADTPSTEESQPVFNWLASITFWVVVVMVIYFPPADLSCCGLKRFREGLSLIPWLASSCNKACFFFLFIFYPGIPWTCGKH